MIEKLAATKHLAVVSDFDGTLAGFANDIYAVHAEPRSLAALERLAKLPDTTVAALSGRHLEGLKRVFRCASRFCWAAPTARSPRGRTLPFRRKPRRTWTARKQKSVS